jgi:histidine triad (HIT) family protein
MNTERGLGGARQEVKTAASPAPERDPDCLFCKLYREGDHVAATDGFVAIRDINPQAPVHLLVLPERHIDSFREIGEFPPDEAKRMLEFVAEVAAREGLTDYRVAVNVGPSAGQTVFHLHWHVKGGWA